METMEGPARQESPSIISVFSLIVRILDADVCLGIICSACLGFVQLTRQDCRLDFWYFYHKKK